MTELYAYREPGRRPVTYLSAAVFALMLILGARGNAPLIYYIPIIAGGSMVLYMLVKNPISGLVLLPDRLILSAWTKPNPVPIRSIARIEIISWSDSADVKVHLKSGEEIRVFSGDIPPKDSFAQALSRVGIPLEVT